MIPDERTTTRLRLRRVRMDDLDTFVALETELRAREVPPRAAPDVAESATYLAAFTRTWDGGELGYWTAFTGKRIAGFGGVQPKLWRDHRCWNLYYRFFPEFQGQGLATDLAREAVTMGAQVHPDWPVLVETRPDNAAAIRVAEAAGLVRQESQDGWAVLLREPDR